MSLEQTQAALTERAAKVGRLLRYRYDGLAQHAAFKGNEHQWALIRNGHFVTTFRTLRDVAVALDLVEAYGPQTGNQHES
jgi:hypothetical protein